MPVERDDDREDREQLPDDAYASDEDFDEDDEEFDEDDDLDEDDYADEDDDEDEDLDEADEDEDPRPMTATGGATRLDDDAIDDLLDELSDWELSEDGSALERTFQFEDFNEAFGFMTQVALFAERIDHHPEWFNCYKRVDVSLTTHSVGGLSGRDAAMARFMSDFVDD